MSATVPVFTEPKVGPLATLGAGGDNATGVRTREIRAMDVVLRQPRASTGLLTEPVSPLGTTAFLEFVDRPLTLLARDK